MNVHQPSREGFVEVDTRPAAQPAALPLPPTEPPPMESAPPPPPVEVWPVTVRLLHRPLRGNNGEELRELSFREPTGGDINRCGNPVRISDSSGDIIIDERKMSMIMAQLSGVLPPLLDRLDPRDWNSCAYRLRSFFLPDPEAWVVTRS